MSKARDLANAGTALGAVTATELGYVDGVTSAIQTQIDSKIGSASAINPNIVDAKGDIIAATAADTVARLAVGANDTVLTADSTAATGLKWAAPAAGGMTLISTTALSGSASVALTSIPSTYTNLQLVIDRAVVTSGGSWRIQVVPNNTSSAIINEIWMLPNSVSHNAGKVYFGEGSFYTETATKTGFTLNIMQYANASAFKHYNTYGVRTTTASGSTDDTNPFAFSSAGVMYSTDAITSLYIKQSNAVNFTGGTAYLYGVK